MQLTKPKSDRLGRLLRQAGHTSAFHLTLVRGGGNNRGFRLTLASGRRLFIKECFQAGPRDRLACESAFLQYLWHAGIRQIPKPILFCPQSGLGVYEYVEGQKLAAEQIGHREIRQALNFYREINIHRKSAPARQLIRAAESCFSPQEHFEAVGNRIKRLLALPEIDAISREAAKFVRQTLASKAKEVITSAQGRLDSLGVRLDQFLPFEDRRLSPSDFGFHNVLVRADGQLVFLDFEYAGWDDPAKTVCDFFGQPERPVPKHFVPEVVATVARQLRDPHVVRERVRIYYPVHQIKWACLILGDFLPSVRNRRDFAQGAKPMDRRAGQLRRARRILLDLSCL